nr:aldehyde dehydrogenase family protein [Massilia sp. YIM B02763]
MGGEVDPDRPGYFIPATVVDNPPEESMIVQDEHFAPIVPIIAYDDVDDVVKRTNDSLFGLGGSSCAATRVGLGHRARRRRPPAVHQPQNHPHP